MNLKFQVGDLICHKLFSNLDDYGLIVNIDFGNYCVFWLRIECCVWTDIESAEAFFDLK